MGWDASRPVPWTRLFREYIIYAGIMVVVLLLFFRESGVAGLIGGVFIAGPVYVGLGAVMAKLGYQRKTLKDLRTPRAEPRTASNAANDAGSARQRPAPTKRTSPGPNRPQRPQRPPRKKR